MFNLHDIKIKSCLAAIAIGSFFISQAQVPYKVADVISDFPSAVILSSTVKMSSFNSLKKELTIIDFFGTWCVPCIKAIPVLDSIQKKYVEKLSIILVSIEKEDHLTKFISTRKNINFPIIVDEDHLITNLFQPVSYPYTVVINSHNQVIAITEAASITDEKIKGWLSQKDTTKDSMKKESFAPENKRTTIVPVDKNPVTELSAEFIYAAKTGSESIGIENKLQSLNMNDLENALKNDDEKKAFWINIYNGYTQLLLKRDADKYKKRSKFFKAKQIPIAGKLFSLDEIEHDILRRSKIKWSLGYFNKLFTSKILKSLRVKQPDYRIHFALNCGAFSCPPIAFYDPANLETQLDIATRSYLTGEASYDAQKNTLQLPAIMGWFRHDFKGKKHMLQLVKKYNIVPQEKKPSISFKKYNWNLYLNNYKN
ncbi:MAG: DUF547 domain-containing protein [Ferruginibacter sp.]